MRPDFRLVANDEDVTEIFRDRLVALHVSDEDGTKADKLEITLDDRDSRIALPEIDATLDLWLGFRETGLAFIGRYAVEGLGGEGGPDLLQIDAAAVDMTSPVRAPRTRAWEDVTLADIVAEIAARASLRPLVGESLAAMRWAYLAQTAESDMHFLTRIAATVDATAKAGGGALVVQRRGEGRTAAGDTVEPVVLTRSRLSGWRWRRSAREDYASVEAEWSDVDGGETRRVTRGEGEPVRRLRHVFATEAEATRAAEAELGRAGRAGLTIDARIAGFEPALFAGGLVRFEGLRPELEGDWHVERVAHALARGLTTEVRARKGAEG